MKFRGSSSRYRSTTLDRILHTRQLVSKIATLFNLSFSFFVRCVLFDYYVLFSIPLSLSLRIKYTKFNIHSTRYLASYYNLSLLISFSDTVCPYPIFSWTARKANEYERLTVPRYKSRRPRLVNRSRKERRGAEQGGKARGREERQPVRGRKKNRYGRPPFHRVPRHYVTRLESWHCVTRWCQDEWLRKLSILPRASFYLVLRIFRRRRTNQRVDGSCFSFSFSFSFFFPLRRNDYKNSSWRNVSLENSVNLRCLPRLFARSTVFTIKSIVSILDKWVRTVSSLRRKMYAIFCI